MDILSELKMPFAEKEVHWRVGSTNAKKLNCKPWEATSGIMLAYIDARDVMKRLDDVVGMENWSDTYEETAKGRMICSLSLKVNDEWIVKSDGAGNTAVEGDKGAISDAFKRAAVKFGVGRYLYYLPNTWTDLRNGKPVSRPTLPDWAKGRAIGVKEQMIAYVEVINEHMDSIYAIKVAISNGDQSLAAEAFWELTQEERTAICIAPSKGGIFTKEENVFLDSNECRNFK